MRLNKSQTDSIITTHRKERLGSSDSHGSTGTFVEEETDDDYPADRESFSKLDRFKKKFNRHLPKRQTDTFHYSNGSDSPRKKIEEVESTPSKKTSNNFRPRLSQLKSKVIKTLTTSKKKKREQQLREKSKRDFTANDQEGSSKLANRNLGSAYSVKSSVFSVDDERVPALDLGCSPSGSLYDLGGLASEVDSTSKLNEDAFPDTNNGSSWEQSSVTDNTSVENNSRLEKMESKDTIDAFALGSARSQMTSTDPQDVIERSLQNLMAETTSDDITDQRLIDAIHENIAKLENSAKQEKKRYKDLKDKIEYVRKQTNMDLENLRSHIDNTKAEISGMEENAAAMVAEIKKKEEKDYATFQAGLHFEINRELKKQEERYYEMMDKMRMECLALTNKYVVSHEGFTNDFTHKMLSLVLNGAGQIIGFIIFIAAFVFWVITLPYAILIKPMLSRQNTKS